MAKNIGTNTGLISSLGAVSNAPLPNSSDDGMYKDKLGNSYKNPVVKDESTLNKFTNILDANGNDAYKTAMYLKSKFPYTNFDFSELEKAKKSGDSSKINELFHTSGASNANAEISDFLKLAAKHNINSDNIDKYDPQALLAAMNDEAKGVRQYKNIDPRFLESAKSVLKDQEKLINTNK